MEEIRRENQLRLVVYPIISLFTRLYTSQLVQDFWNINSISRTNPTDPLEHPPGTPNTNLKGSPKHQQVVIRVWSMFQGPVGISLEYWKFKANLPSNKAWDSNARFDDEIYNFALKKGDLYT